MEIRVNFNKVKIWDLNDYYKQFDKEKDYSLKGDAPILLKIRPYYVELNSLIYGVPYTKIPIVSEYILAVKNRTLDKFRHKITFKGVRR